jgi:CRISPR/Cas system-associated endoribonuclease Cas2
MVSELFRTYLTPDEAEALKNKVKEFVKLKEMLILVVMMQKKKLKLD